MTEKHVLNRPFLFVIRHHDLPSLFAGKVHTLLTRKYVKERDWYDLMWYLSRDRSLSPNPDLLRDSLKQTGHGHISEENWKQAILKRAAMLTVSGIDTTVDITGESLDVLLCKIGGSRFFSDGSMFIPGVGPVCLRHEAIDERTLRKAPTGIYVFTVIIEDERLFYWAFKEVVLYLSMKYLLFSDQKKVRLKMQVIKCLGLVLSLVLIQTHILHAQCTRCAALVMDGAFIDSDVAIAPGGQYGSLDGPVIENKYFAPYLPVMGIYISQDCLGKRQYIPVAEKLIENVDRHGGYGWGEDVWPSGGPPKLGIGGYGVLINGAVNSPKWDNIDSLETAIVSAAPEDTKLRFTFYGWNVGGRKITAVWTLSTHWEARWIKNTFEVPADLGYSLVFAVSPHLSEQEYVKNADSATIHGLSIKNSYAWFTESDRLTLVALKVQKSQFEKFYYDNDHAGIQVVPDAAGKVTGWNMLSWGGEPASLFDEADWESKMFEGIDGEATGTKAPFDQNQNKKRISISFSGNNGPDFISKPGARKVNIYNTSGRRVFTSGETNGNVSWKTSGKSGIYLIETVYESERQITKLIL